MDFFVPAQSVETVLEVKKSRFISRVGFADSRESAMRLLDDAKLKYADARHHCWAYNIGSSHSPMTAAMSDDGEPSGTAGKPIMNVLNHKQISNIMVVVVRYFGGVKLGAGGLVRAYSAAAQQGIDALPIKKHAVLEELVVITDFSQEQILRHWLDHYDGNIVSVNYTEKVRITVTLPAQNRPNFESQLVKLKVNFQPTKPATSR